MSQTIRRIAVFFCFALSLALVTSVARAQTHTITVLHNFSGGGDGAYPETGLTMDREGNLYGTTTYDGAGGWGTVFRLSHEGSGWILTTLFSFDGYQGANPASGVVFGPDGNLYGTTAEESGISPGTLYRLQPPPTACHSVSCPWTRTVLHTFEGGDDGSDPGPGNLVFDQAGNIYGTTVFGGFGQEGVVYELSPSDGGWTESVLFYFDQQTGYMPESGVIFDNAGNLYGTTSEGGANGSGVVYKLSPSGSGWTESTLASIGFHGSATCGGLVFDGQGNLYGASGECALGGGSGGVFELTPSNGSWTFNVLHAFSGGGGPYAGVTLDAAGNVYGTSAGTGLYGKGEAFKLTPSNGSWIYNSVSFDGSNGTNPLGNVILDSAGTIYGTTDSGGSGPCNIEGIILGCGVVWEITQ